MSELFRQLMTRDPALAEFELVSPPQSAQRGAQLTYRHPDAVAICQALIAHGVIPDFRAPDLLRVGFSPLPLRFSEVGASVTILRNIMQQQLWRGPQYAVRNTVT